MTGASRAQLRAEILGRIPRWYSPALHLAAPAAIALGVAVAALALVHDVRAWQLGAVPLFLLVANAVEWHAHRDLLHRRVRSLERLYLDHTPMHHAVFSPGEMAIRGLGELPLVLLHPVAFPAFLLVNAPIAALLAWLGGRNLGLLWIATAMLDLMAYEALHLVCHLPPRGPLGWRIAVGLRRHHQRHHDLRLKHRWNLNVTVPLWDALHGTIWRPTTSRVHSSRVEAAKLR